MTVKEAEDKVEEILAMVKLGELANATNEENELSTRFVQWVAGRDVVFESPSVVKSVAQSIDRLYLTDWLRYYAEEE